MTAPMNRWDDTLWVHNSRHTDVINMSPSCYSSAAIRTDADWSLMIFVRSLACLIAGSAALSAQIARADEAQGAVAASVPAPAPQAGPAKADSTFDEIWRIPTIHDDKEGDVLNQVRIIGRLHLDNYVLDSDIGDDSDFVARRTRLGVKAKMFRRLDVQVQGDFNLEGGGPLYIRLTDAHLAWKFSDAAILTVGKQSPEFTLDGAQSSNRILTISRSNINNTFGVASGYAPGVTLRGQSGNWTYKAGIYTSGKDNGEFGNFSGGPALIGSVGYDFGKQLGLKRAVLRGDYLYNKPDPDGDFFRPLKHVGALIFMVDNNDWGVWGEGVIAKGSLGQSDGHGVSVMPWINLSKKVQVVTRFTHMKSDDINGLRFSRYESVITSKRGDRYNEAYAGLNYYIHGHNLKLQTGLTYANMRDRAHDGGAYDGITWTTALRLSW